jgi:hypothetical protein
MDVMDLIEKEAVLAPLQVLSILALNPRLPLHVAANYMSSTLKVCVCLLFINVSVFWCLHCVVDLSIVDCYNGTRDMR